MADEVLISPSKERAKLRHPWVVLGLSIITIGVYSIFWWFYINRELRDLGRARNVSGLGDSPGVSCAAWGLGWFFGWLILWIPNVWTIVTTSIRLHRGQRVAMGEPTFNGWIAGLLWIFTLGLGGIVYTQYQLNRIWELEPVLTPTGLVGGPTDLDRLEQLNSLKDSGAISQEEFDAEKAKLMPQVPPAVPAPPPAAEQLSPPAPGPEGQAPPPQQ